VFARKELGAGDGVSDSSSTGGGASRPISRRDFVESRSGSVSSSAFSTAGETPEQEGRKSRRGARSHTGIEARNGNGNRETASLRDVLVSPRSPAGGSTYRKSRRDGERRRERRARSRKHGEEMRRASEELGRGARGAPPRSGVRAAAAAWLYVGAQIGPETRRITITSTSLRATSGCYARGTMRETGAASPTAVFVKCGLPGPGRTKDRFVEEARIQDRIATCSDTTP
jgi:hypothetical protein